MSIEKAVVIGLAGNEVSKKITGSDECSVGRSVVAVGSGAAIGAVAGGTLVVGAGLVGLASAPVVVPLAIGGAIVSGIASLFD
ncbi:hypothetical protein JYT78_00630 [bacterium AH-315-I20]|nr:hypothetical protein [bacterium AH-315-I20]PCI02725.1 MAG: hypothetical protein COB79_01765 [Zetaproteobacteria bacterium]